MHESTDDWTRRGLEDGGDGATSLIGHNSHSSTDFRHSPKGPNLGRRTLVGLIVAKFDYAKQDAKIGAVGLRREDHGSTIGLF